MGCIFATSAFSYSDLRSSLSLMSVVAISGRAASSASRLLAGLHDAGEQPQDGHRLCQRVRRVSSRVLLAGICRGVARGCICRSVRLVRHGRLSVLVVRAATGLSVLEILGRSRRRRSNVGLGMKLITGAAKP